MSHYTGKAVNCLPERNSQKNVFIITDVPQQSTLRSRCLSARFHAHVLQCRNLHQLVHAAAVVLSVPHLHQHHKHVHIFFFSPTCWNMFFIRVLGASSWVFKSLCNTVSWKWSLQHMYILLQSRVVAAAWSWHKYCTGFYQLHQITQITQIYEYLC